MKKYIFLIFVIVFLIKNFTVMWPRFFIDHSGFFNDFNAYYVGSYLFWHNGNPYDLTGDFTRTVETLKLNFLFGSGYCYPPLIAFVFYPLLFFSVDQAFRIFSILSIILYLIFCYLIINDFKITSKFQAIVLPIMLATFTPAIDSANHGQLNIIILFCFYFYLKYQEKNKLSSFLLAIAGLIKVYPLLFLIKEFLQKKIKFIVKTLIWIAFFFLIFVIFRGFDLIGIYFFKILPVMNNSLDAYYTNQSINGFLSRLLSVGNGKYLISQSIYQPIILGITILTLSVLSFITLKWKKSQQSLFLLWLGTISLLAGKNSFSNFAPTILIGIYLLENFSLLGKKSKFLFILSIFLSNLIWLSVWRFNREYIITPTLSSHLIYSIVSSVGFFYLLIQTFLIGSLKKKN